MSRPVSDDLPVTPISLEVFRNIFASVAEEMGAALQRSSFSPNIKERLDFSCAIFDARARMIAQAAHIPVHLGSMPASVQQALESFDTFQPGDIIILNDPYCGGTHLPDVTMISPVFLGEKLLYFAASRAHHADVGGMSPGSLPLSTELFQEGIIIPPLRITSGGIINRDLLKLITANTRAPQERMGDFEAQLAAQRLGEKRLLALVKKHGEERMLLHASALMDYSRRMTEEIIRSIPRGVYTFREFLDGDGQREEPIPIQVSMKISGDSIRVDFEGSAPQVEGNLNAVPAVVRSAVWYCIRLLAREDFPVNDGCFQPVRVILPSHSVLNPDFPAAVSAGNVETSQRIVDAVLGCLSRALPERIPAASQGTMNNVTFGGVNEMGEAFVFYETIAGGHGAGPTGDGLSGRQCHMTNTLSTPVEAIEYSLPVRVLQFELRSGSGGAGKYQGGEGVTRTYEFLEPARVTLNCERRESCPYGLAGGTPGGKGADTLIRAGAEIPLPGKSSFQVRPGDQLRIETPGGGGWGERP